MKKKLFFNDLYWAIRKRGGLAVLSFVLNMLVYYGARYLKSENVFDLRLPFERSCPFIPCFILIYFACYGVWTICYLVMLMDDERVYDFYAADHLSRLICFLFFIFLPCSIDRPLIEGSGVFDRLVSFLYMIDPPDNLFPSIHCLVTAFCLLGFLRHPLVKEKWKVMLAVFLLLVILSTLFLYQHVFLDTVAGVLLAYFCLNLSSLFHLGDLYRRFFE